MGTGFDGKVVLVTGGSSGIGEATAKQFAAKRASLSITGRNLINLEKVSKECRSLGAKDVLSIPAEFSKLEDVKKVLEKTIEKFGRLDILVNNAGTIMDTPFATFKMEDYDTLFDINLKSVLFLTQLAMPYLVESKGNIVNVSSLGSTHQYPRQLLYCMAKAALDQFTKTLALEYAPKGVRVNSVNPSVVRTALNRARGYSEEQAKEFYDNTTYQFPLGRIGDADEIASAILFFASNESGWTTGQCLILDGGTSLTVQQ